MNKLIAILVLIYCSSVAAIEVRGASSCGAWVSSRQANNLAARSNELWMVAYLSGLSSGLGKDGLRGTDNASIFLFVDNYCRNNPLKDIDDAAHAVFRELLAKNKL
jgi:hypothetical protein